MTSVELKIRERKKRINFSLETIETRKEFKIACDVKGMKECDVLRNFVKSFIEQNKASLDYYRKKYEGE